MKIGTITINIFLPMINKLVYSCSIKIHASGFDELLEIIFCLLLAVEVFSMQKVVDKKSMYGNIKDPKEQSHLEKDARGARGIRLPEYRLYCKAT